MLMSFLCIPLFLIAPQLGHRVQRQWGKGWCWFMGIDVTCIGVEKMKQLGNAGAVLAPNHESMFDMPVIASLPVDVKWISKKEIAYIPFVGGVMRAMGCYFVTRDRSGKDLNVMKEVEQGLRDGVVVVIFPEGTRTRTGELLPIRKGAFKTAQNAQVPVVPVAIAGTRQIAPAGSLPHRRGHRVVVRIGDPIQLPPDAPILPVIENYRTQLIHLLEQNRSELNPS